MIPSLNTSAHRLPDNHLDTIIALPPLSPRMIFPRQNRRAPHPERIRRVTRPQLRSGLFTVPSTTSHRQILPTPTRAGIDPRRFRQGLQGILRHIRPIQSAPSCVERLDKEAQSGESGGHDGVVCLDVQPEEWQDCFDGAECWSCLGPIGGGEGVDAGEDYDQQSRGKCNQDHALVAALCVDGVENPNGDREDGYLEDGVGDGDADPPSRLGENWCQQRVFVFDGLCDLRKSGTFDRTKSMVFCSRILSPPKP
jgi:hypothetical protein